MKSKTLLVELMAQPYQTRFRRLVELGREAKTNPKLLAVFDTWEKGDWQERLFAVQSCASSGDANRLQRLTDDASMTVSGLAIRLLADHGGDEVLIEVLRKLSRRRRSRLLSRLRSRRRFTVIDGFLETLLATPGPNLGALVPFASPAGVVRHFAIGEEYGGSMFWERLARIHPKIAIQGILERLAKTDAPEGLLLRQARTVLLYAGRAESSLAVELVRALAAFVPLATLPVTYVSHLRPTELARVALDAKQTSLFPCENLPGRIETALLLELLRAYPDALSFRQSWFQRLAPLERGLIFDEVGRSWRDGEGLFPTDALALLPGKHRIKEAQRNMALPLMSTRPPMQALYAGYLPWVEMRPIVDRFLTHPEGEMRASGWTALLTCLRYHRDQVNEVLPLIRKRKFEQDPVRMAILQGLTFLPPCLWKPIHLDDLAGMIRESLDATDLSPASTMYLTGFVQELIPSFPEWSSKQLAIIYSERGNIGGYYLESRINDRQALILEKAFIDVGVHWGKGNRVGWLVWFASALGRRLRVCQSLRTALEELLGKNSGFYVSSILQLLREHGPIDDFARLTKRLIKANESWVALNPIFTFLHRYRQDWLEPFLANAKFRMAGGSHVELVQLLPSYGYRRYTTSQQQVLAKTLNDIIKLPKGESVPVDVWTMLRAIQHLALLPAGDFARLIALSNDIRPVIAEAAIRALGRLDAGQGLPTLMQALDDSRARIAIYALRHSISGMPGDRVLAALSTAPMTKVTVAKETIRLVGEFAGPSGFDWLLGLTRQQLHRDVRIAVLRGLWDHLERPESWQVLSAAAKDTDGQILNNVIRIPADRLSVASRRRLIDLLIGLAKHSDAIIRLGVFRRFVEMPFPDEDGRVVRMALPALAAASPDERGAAANVVAVNAYPSDAEAVAKTVVSIRERRRPLHDLLQALTTFCLGNSPGRRRLAPVAQAVIDSLRDDPATGGLRIKLAAVALGITGFETELSNLRANQLLHVAILNEAASALDQLARTPDRRHLEQLENNLALSTDPNLRWLAFKALVVQARDEQRWNDARRERITRFRNDPAPAVAMAAQYYFDAEAD